MRDLKEESISRIDLFRSCSPAQIRSIAKLGDWVDVPDGTLIVNEGDRAGEFVVILSGTAAATDSADSGEWTVLEAGSFFGQAEIAGDKPHEFSVHSLTPMRLLVFEVRAFRRLIDSTPPIAWKLLTNLADRAAAG
jgi:CRP-like cAMP-binding protein